MWLYNIFLLLLSTLNERQNLMGKVEKVYTRKTGQLVGIVKRFCYDGRGYATVVTASGHIRDMLIRNLVFIKPHKMV